MAGPDRGVRALGLGLIAAGMCAATPAQAADRRTLDELRRELDAMKQRVERVEQKTRDQEEVIRKQDAVIKNLSGGAKAATAPATTAPAATTAHDEELEKTITEKVARRMQSSLAAANKTFPSQFNPAIGFAIDTVGSYSNTDRANFEFRAGELALSAEVDPFVRGYANLNGTPDHGVEVEEAAIVTTSLPYNLGLKAGRFFADFGRLSKFHDHDLPFVNRPMALDRFVGGESQGDGLEASWLLPIPHFVTLTAGAYDKVGAENDRVNDALSRDYSQFTYLGRAFTFLPVDDANSVDFGLSWAVTPEVRQERGAQRSLVGVDLTYRYAPLDRAAYNGLVWGTELLYNQEDRPVGGFPTDGTPTTALAFKRRGAVGLYSYVEPRLTRRFYPGFLFEYVQDVDKALGDTLAYSPYLTVWASEFQRLRFQYTRLEAPGQHDNQFFLQWTVVLGSHVHGFKDR